MKFNSYVLLLLMLLVWGCGNGERKARKKEEATTKENTTPASSRPKELNLYLETSGSMSGFLTGSTQFKAVVSSLVAQLERADIRDVISQTNYYLIPEGTQTDTVRSGEQLQEMLTNDRLAQGKSSKILDIFKMVRDNSNKNKVSIFISDCILSDFKPENRDIMQSQTSMIFNDLASRGMAVSVYAFTSQFNGKYTKQDARPFYIWMIGDSEPLDKLRKKFKDIGLNPAEELHQGYTFNNAPAFQLLNSTMKAGEGEFMPAKNNQSLNILQLYRNKPIQFAMGIDLSSFPESSTNERTLGQMLTLQPGPNLTAELKEVLSRQRIDLKGKDRQRADENNLTHFAVVKISELKSNNSWFELQLDRPAAANWHEEWSTLETKQPEGKTYGFQYMINGLKSAYRNIESKPYFTIRVEVTKS